MNKHTLLFHPKSKTRDMQLSIPTGYRHCTHRSLCPIPHLTRPYSCDRAPPSTAHTDRPQHPREQQFSDILILPFDFGFKNPVHYCNQYFSVDGYRTIAQSKA